MKKTTFIGLLLLFTAVCSGVSAQQITVITKEGTASAYLDLNLAIQKAASGSTLYLPGSDLHINDSVKITKPINIVGVGHTIKGVDYINSPTKINGTISFQAGSAGSSLQGVYLTGNINIGTAEQSVDNILIRFCNINSVQVANWECKGILLNQNYIRGNSNGGGSATHFTNCVASGIQNLNNGLVKNCIVFSWSTSFQSSCWQSPVTKYAYYFANIKNSVIQNNIHLFRQNGCDCFGGDMCHESIKDCEGSIISNNITLGNPFGDNVIQVKSDSLFVDNSKGISPDSDFHLVASSLAKNAGTDGKDCGIYGGSGFSNYPLLGRPRIANTKIADKTDENGKLHIEVEVVID